MTNRSKNSKNGNKALQGFLGLVILVGAVLGLTAFILHFTNKKNCSEGYEDGTDGDNSGSCKFGDDCRWDDCSSCSGNCVDWVCVPKYWKGKVNDFCNNDNQCASEICNDNKCFGPPKVCVGEENEQCDDDRECLSLYCLDNKCTGKTQCKSSNICPPGQKCNAHKGRDMDGYGYCGPPNPDSTIAPGQSCELSTGLPCLDGYCEWNANVGTCSPWWDLCNSPT